MNKYLVVVPIWNKRDMIPAILTGMSICLNPKEVDLWFMFDGCTDDSWEVYTEISHLLLPDFAKLATQNEVEQYEFKCHNIALSFMMTKEYIAAVLLQDDNILLQPTFMTWIDVACNVNNIGVIGCRDGFYDMDGRAIGSEWSEPKSNRIVNLEVGQARQIRFINNGPIVYPKSTVEKIGLLDTESFTYHYGDADYSGRCHGAGLRNFVIGTKLFHGKFGKVSQSKVYDPAILSKDTANFVNKRNEGLYGTIDSMH